MEDAASDTASEAQPPPKHTREPGVTCMACRLSKVRCDKQSPCGRCRRRGITCVAQTKEKRRRGRPQAGGNGRLQNLALMTANEYVMRLANEPAQTEERARRYFYQQQMPQQHLQQVPMAMQRPVHPSYYGQRGYAQMPGGPLLYVRQPVLDVPPQNPHLRPIAPASSSSSSSSSSAAVTQTGLYPPNTALKQFQRAERRLSPTRPHQQAEMPAKRPRDTALDEPTTKQEPPTTKHLPEKTPPAKRKEAPERKKRRVDEPMDLAAVWSTWTQLTRHMVDHSNAQTRAAARAYLRATVANDFLEQHDVVVDDAPLDDDRADDDAPNDEQREDTPRRQREDAVVAEKTVVKEKKPQQPMSALDALIEIADVGDAAATTTTTNEKDQAVDDDDTAPSSAPEEEEEDKEDPNPRDAAVVIPTEETRHGVIESVPIQKHGMDYIKLLVLGKEDQPDDAPRKQLPATVV